MSLWSQEYSENGIAPEFYSDAQSKLNHAKRIALTYSLSFFPVCILDIGFIVFEIWILNDKMHSIMHFMWYLVLLVQTMVVIEFGYFALQTVFYYFRVKKYE